MKKVLFLGFGHLGQYFEELNESHQITATKRNISQSNDKSLIAYSLGDAWNEKIDFDVVIISFPTVENYAKKLKKLLNSLGVEKKIIFISSTSVYGMGNIDETSNKLGITQNALELIMCEKLIEGLHDYVIIRPGGLIDNKRHPKIFSKKISNIKVSKTNVNLVHTYDVAAFLHFIILNNLKNEDYNLICDEHPSKEEFYGYFNPELKFDSEYFGVRIITNLKSKKVGFEYKYSKLDWCK